MKNVRVKKAISQEGKNKFPDRPRLRKKNISYLRENVMRGKLRRNKEDKTHVNLFPTILDLHLPVRAIPRVAGNETAAAFSFVKRHKHSEN